MSKIAECQNYGNLVRVIFCHPGSIRLLNVLDRHLPAKFQRFPVLNFRKMDAGCRMLAYLDPWACRINR